MGHRDYQENPLTNFICDWMTFNSRRLILWDWLPILFVCFLKPIHGHWRIDGWGIDWESGAKSTVMQWNCDLFNLIKTNAFNGPVCTFSRSGGRQKDQRFNIFDKRKVLKGINWKWIIAGNFILILLSNLIN